MAFDQKTIRRTIMSQAINWLGKWAESIIKKEKEKKKDA